MGMFLLALLIFLALTGVAFTRATVKKGKLEDYNATLASGSRDPKIFYAHKRQARMVSFLWCVIIALVVYLVICMI